MASSSVIGILRVLLTANTAEYETAMKQVGVQMRAMSRDLTKMGAQATAAGQLLTAGLTLPIVGMAAVGVKAAADFDSAMANVRKTVGTDTAESKQAVAALGDELRQMAKEVPRSVDELANIAALGGQFGIGAENLGGFVRTVADLGVAVDGISMEEAATTLAQFAGVTGVADENISTLASALVELGNKGKSSEGIILEFSKRLSGAGVQIGLTAPEIMGLGASMANLGIEAEAGGTAMSKVMAKMEAAVARGGDSLAKFARVAGMSSQQFADLFGAKPIAAVDAFVSGLGKMKDQGEVLTLVLDDMEMKDSRLVSALKMMSQAQGEVTKQADIASAAALANNKHTEEAAEKYKTFWNQLVLLGNELHDVAITFGTALLPMFARLVDFAKPAIAVLAKIAEGFAALPVPIQTLIVGFGAVLAAIGPVLLIVGSLLTAMGTVTGAFATGGIALRVWAGLAGTSTTATTLLTTSITLLGSAVSLTAAAFAGWQIGTWLGDITGLTDAFGKWVAEMGEGLMLLPRGTAAQYDASRAAAAHREATQGNTAAQIEAKQKAAELKATQDGLFGRDLIIRANALAGALGDVSNIAKLSAEKKKELKIAVDAALEAYKKLGQTAPDNLRAIAAALLPVRVNTEGAAKAAEELKKRLDALYGRDLIAKALEYAKDLGDISNLSKLTTEKKKELHDAVQKAIEAYRLLGEVAPEKLHAILAATTPLLKSTLDLGKSWVALAAPVKDAGVELQNLAAGLAADGTLLVRTFEEQEAASKAAAAALQAWIDKGGEFVGPIEDTGAAVEHVKGIVDGFKDTLRDIPELLQQAFTGGGGLGAIKAIGIKLADDIIGPLEKKLSGLSKGAIAVGAAGATALGGAVAGSMGAQVGGIASSLGGLAVTASQWGTKMAASGIMGSVALGAVTMGIGAAAVGVGMLIKKWWAHRKAVKESQQQVEAFQQGLHEQASPAQKAAAGTEKWKLTVIAVRDAYLATGRSAAEAEAIVKQLWDTDHPEKAAAAIKQINLVLEEQKDLLEKDKQALTDLQAEHARLAEEATIDWNEMKAAAERYGIDVDSLGDKFQGQRIHEAAANIVNDFDLLVKNGASVGGVLFGMKEELIALALDAKKFGVALPANLKPLFDELERSGNLIGENGEKLVDLKDIQFGDPIVTKLDAVALAMENIAKKIEELIAKITGPLIDAVAKIPTDKKINVEVDYHDPGFNLGDGVEVNPVHMAKGGIVESPTLALIGEGASPEAVIPLDRLTDTRRGFGGDIIVMPFLPVTDPYAAADEAASQFRQRVGIDSHGMRETIERVIDDWMRTYVPVRT